MSPAGKLETNKGGSIPIGLLVPAVVAAISAGYPLGQHWSEPVRAYLNIDAPVLTPVSTEHRRAHDALTYEDVVERKRFPRLHLEEMMVHPTLLAYERNETMHLALEGQFSSTLLSQLVNSDLQKLSLIDGMDEEDIEESIESLEEEDVEVSRLTALPKKDSSLEIDVAVVLDPEEFDPADWFHHLKQNGTLIAHLPDLSRPLHS